MMRPTGIIQWPVTDQCWPVVRQHVPNLVGLDPTYTELQSSVLLGLLARGGF